MFFLIFFILQYIITKENAWVRPKTTILSKTVRRARNIIFRIKLAIVIYIQAILWWSEKPFSWRGEQLNHEASTWMLAIDGRITLKVSANETWENGPRLTSHRSTKNIKLAVIQIK